MIEEPYRWVEAIANRREYIEDRLAGGSPVVLTQYDGGLLLFTAGHGNRKIFEIYDRIGFAALGHPADIERMRLAAIDLAHVEGFSRAVSDVSLRRLVNYSLSPALKSAFEQVYSAPFIVRMLLAELGDHAGDDSILRVDYDGAYRRTEVEGKLLFEVLAGRDDVETAMRAYVARQNGESKSARTLDDALRLSAKAWAVGIEVLGRAADEDKSGDEAAKAAKPLDEARAWKDHVKGRHVEAAVLERSRPASGKFRLLDEKDCRAALKDIT